MLQAWTSVPMDYRSWMYGVLVVVLISRVDGKISEADSFDESFEEGQRLSPELKNALQPAEDALFTFINRLVNTGYSSSKIALNRVEKASQRRKEFGERLEQFLAGLPMYQIDNIESEEQIPVADQIAQKPPTVSKLTGANEPVPANHP